MDGECGFSSAADKEHENVNETIQDDSKNCLCSRRRVSDTDRRPSGGSPPINSANYVCNLEANDMLVSWKIAPVSPSSCREPESNSCFRLKYDLCDVKMKE